LGRARYANNAITNEGVAVHIEPFAEVAVFIAGTTTPYPGTLYANESGGTTKSNPFNADQYGNVEFWLETKDEVKLEVTGPGLGTKVSDYEPVPPRPDDMIIYSPTQAGLEARLALGEPVLSPGGITQISTTVTIPIGASIIGSGDFLSIFEWIGADDGVMFDYEEDPLPVAFSHSSMQHLAMRTVASNVTGIKRINGGVDYFSDIAFFGIERHFHIEGGFRPAINDIFAAGYGPNNCGGSYFKSMPHIDIKGYTTFRTSDAEGVLVFSYVAGGTITNTNMIGCDTTAFIIEGDCQGLVFTGGLIAGMTRGVLYRSVTEGDDEIAPTFCEFIGVKFDQADSYCAEVVWGGQLYFTRCEFTNSRHGIIVGPYNGVDPPQVIRFGVFLCTFENIGSNGIAFVGGATYFNVLGNHFLGMGASSVGADPPISPAWDNAGVPIVIGGGTTEDVLVAFNDMRNNADGTIADGSTGNNRCYWFNTGDDPVITNPAGASVQTVNQLQTDKWILLKQVASVAENPPTGYHGIYFKTDGNMYRKTAAGDEVRILDADIFTAAGSIIKATSAETFDELAIGTAGQFLEVISGAPAWTSNKGCRVYRATTQAIPTATDTLISFSTERWDTDNCWALSPNPTRLVATTAGKYEIGAMITFAPDATGQRAVILRVSNAFFAAQGFQNATGGSLGTGLCVATVVDLAANDYLEVIVYQNRGSDLNVEAGDGTNRQKCEAWITRIGK
jgi:hypothetical protein